MHTIFATHFGGPLPRWADEGACTTVEHPDERARQDHLLKRYMLSKPPQSIPFNRMFRLTEYPRPILPLYAQSHSVARFLIQHGGKRKFIDYVGAGMQSRDWDRVTMEFYGYRDLSDLQVTWVKWVAKGSPVFDGSTQGGTVPPALAMDRSQSLTITTPLPPLLRPTNANTNASQISNVIAAPSRYPRASAEPARSTGTRTRTGTEKGSWYATRKNAQEHTTPTREGAVPTNEYAALKNQPRRLLPPRASDLMPAPEVSNAPRQLSWTRVTESPQSSIRRKPILDARVSPHDGEMR